MTAAPALIARPDTALADTADAMLRAAAPPTLVAHCHRTYVFAAALLDRRGLDYDREALFLGAALHDLGLTPTWTHATTPFEEHGAQVAHEALLQQGARPELADLVADAIRLHLLLTTAYDPRPEVAGIHLGAGVDVVGLRIDKIPPTTVDLALETFPRQSLASFLRDALGEEARRKPDCTMAQLVREVDFLDLLANGPGE
ncbi:HD domain-containing protein [Streptomyces sp. NPDC005963]|uniref:HD domain-containing protein n=1 Tax=Streptomyces sp. NPDC005963 TaxID=3156721 RepID=UPI0033E1A0B1